MFELTADDLALLSDEDLRELVARLCESELKSRGISPGCVTWGGHQDAPDGGVDVRVSLPQVVEGADFIPRSATVFQTKAEDMPSSKIREEMCPKGLLRPAIRELADRGGAYIIVSSEAFTTDAPLRDRRKAMEDAVSELPNPSALKLDFYDRRRLETWLRSHAGTTLWVRERIGKPLQGWSGHGAWSFRAERAGSDYLLDDQVRINTLEKGTTFALSAGDGIDKIREVLRNPQGVVRLVGLSGVGKTRLAEALFDDRVGERSLNQELAAYTDMSRQPNPDPITIAREFVAANKRAIIVVDNCPPNLHRHLSELCRSNGSQLSLITVEYDIREDQPEGTDVFALEPASVDVTEKVIKRRFPELSQIDAHRIAESSGGNARIAIVLAATVQKNDSISTLSDDDLFRRLFEQGHASDKELLSAAQALSLVYSFEGEDVSEAEAAELVYLGRLVKQDAHDMFKHCSQLERRGLVQRRAQWRAVLPPAIANRLASAALQEIPPSSLADCFLTSGRERLLRSFSRRLGYLGGSQQARSIVKAWLRPGALLADVLNFSELHRTMFNYVAPVAPQETLAAIQRALPASKDPEVPSKCRQYLRLLRSLAYEAELFDRCIALIQLIAKAGNVNDPHDESRRVFVSLFTIWFSGTHATGDQRLKAVRSLLTSDDPKERTLGVAALEAMLEAVHFTPTWDFEFGTRSRDYGYAPKTPEDVKHWFAQALHVAQEFACSDRPVAPEVRRIVAHQFRGLWSKAAMYDELRTVCRNISEKGFWREGWLAVRQTIHYDSNGFWPEVAAGAAALESDLRPRGLVQRVRSIVLAQSAMFSGIDSTVDATTDVQPVVAQVESTSHDLGVAVAADEESLALLLPDVVTARTEQLWHFGRGLADGAEPARPIWNELVAQLSKTAASTRTIQTLGGFLSALKVREPDLVDVLLDDCVDDSVLGPVYPALQTCVGIDEKGLNRLLRSLDVHRAPIWIYRNLVSGGVTHKLPGHDFNGLLLRIAAEPEGLDIALEILQMRLAFEGRSQSTIAELIKIGCELMRRITFTGSRTDVEIYKLGIISRSCLLGEEGASAVREICQNLKNAVVNSETHAFYHEQFLKILLQLQPLASLDALCGGGRSDLETGMAILMQAGQLRGNPFDLIADPDLLAWCDQQPDSRYPAIAAGITSFRLCGDSAQPKWTDLAQKVLEKAPDRVAVARQFIANFIPIAWSGSRATIVESNAKLLDDLLIYPDPALAELVKGEKLRLETVIQQEHDRQDLIDRQIWGQRTDERFE